MKIILERVLILKDYIANHLVEIFLDVFTLPSSGMRAYVTMKHVRY
jgi:hypothetical protein